MQKIRSWKRKVQRTAATVLLSACICSAGGAVLLSGILQPAAFAACEDHELPGYWYAGEFGKKPTVKSQGSKNTCWALAASSALELSLLPEKHVVFSADHMSLNNAFTIDQSEGGDYSMIMAYLSGWQGPVAEAEEACADKGAFDEQESSAHIQEMQLLTDPDQEEIKYVVYRYGAVQTSLFMNRKMTDSAEGYYNPETAAFFFPEEKTPDHDVLILGWDDSFPKEKFDRQPAEDGAFICLNSWGSDFGEDGIFYVSYEDANIGKKGMVYSRVENTENYTRLYQTDECGWRGGQGYESDTCWFANVYTAEAEEQLAAVGFYATGRDTSYEIYLVHDFAGAESFADMVFLQSGNMEYAGYYTVDLNGGEMLRSGERFAVAVKITTPEAENPVAVEYRADQYTQNVSTEGKEGYISRFGKNWDCTEKRYGTNVCLKVYTR